MNVFYVLVSRVTSFAGLRLLEADKSELEKLSRLTWGSHLEIWEAGFNAGVWSGERVAQAAPVIEARRAAEARAAAGAKAAANQRAQPLERLKRVELQGRCKDLGLSEEGRKKDLIERLLARVSRSLPTQHLPSAQPPHTKPPPTKPLPARPLCAKPPPAKRPSAKPPSAKPSDEGSHVCECPLGVRSCTKGISVEFCGMLCERHAEEEYGEFSENWRSAAAAAGCTVIGEQVSMSGADNTRNATGRALVLVPLEMPFVKHVDQRLAELRRLLTTNKAVVVTFAGKGDQLLLGTGLAVQQWASCFPVGGPAAHTQFCSHLQTGVCRLRRDFLGRVFYGTVSGANANTTNIQVWLYLYS